MREFVETIEGHERAAQLDQRRAHLTHLFASLPSYGSSAYWQALEETDASLALPLEVLVKCIRASVALQDTMSQKHTFEILFRRIATTNIRWANNVLRASHLSLSEQSQLAHDLYADICECVIRAVLNPTRPFWEENFAHCLTYERKHIYYIFMQREKRWQAQRNRTSTPILCPSFHSSHELDQFGQPMQRHTEIPLIEDEVARQALLAVEQNDIPALVIDLPAKLKAVILLIFWEDKTEKDTANLLGITDRTVRNRLKRALQLLHQQLESEKLV